jgi:hypothetical protein
MLLPRMGKNGPLMALVAVLAAIAGCSTGEPDEAALASACMRASDDNRVKFSSSWLSNAEVEVRGETVTVRTEVPVGMSIGGTVKFRYRVYRCRRHGEQMEFIGFENFETRPE